MAIKCFVDTGPACQVVGQFNSQLSVKSRMQFLRKPVNAAQEILALWPHPVYLVLAKVPDNISSCSKKDRGKLLSSEKAITSMFLMSGKFNLFSNVTLPGNREDCKSQSQLSRPQDLYEGLDLMNTEFLSCSKFCFSLLYLWLLILMELLGWANEST